MGFLVMGEGLPQGLGQEVLCPGRVCSAWGPCPLQCLPATWWQGQKHWAACTVDLCESLMICEP